ncbi:MAG: DNA-formamidopyrimidine glycosylase family protein [Myxococcota bacterium]
MPERPDLEYVIPILDKQLTGQRITGVKVGKPVVLRVALPGKPDELLVGQTFRSVGRRAHFVMFTLEGPTPLELVVSPMLAGRFLICEAKQKATADTAMTFMLGDGRELRYRDDVQMGKVYLIAPGSWEQVPGLKDIGVDVLDAKKFTREAFRALARKRRDQAKVFLMDKSALDALGNAYADEVLFEAGVHPKTFVKSLSDAELDTLHDALVRVLTEARDTIAARKPPLDEKLRDFLKVRLRHGEKCPRCSTTIRKAGVHGHDAFFCPQCQPETRKSGIVDWRKAPG